MDTKHHEGKIGVLMWNICSICFEYKAIIRTLYWNDRRKILLKFLFTCICSCELTLEIEYIHVYSSKLKSASFQF